MSDTKQSHTPGPWSVEPERHGSDRFRVIAQVDRSEGKSPYGIWDVVVAAKASEADARLIAAAPEMREALEIAIGIMDDEEASVIARDDALRFCRAALAKAGGR